MEVYLDNAATSHPKPDSVVKAVAEALTSGNANPGRSGHRRALNAARTLLSCREALCPHLGCADPFDVIFSFNCTDALNLAIKGSLYRGDHVVSSWLEHNSVLRVLEGLRLRGQIDLTLLAPESDGRVSPRAIERALKPTTRLVALTQASNVTGVLQRVDEVGVLCRRYGLLFLVDGAQGFGLSPVNVVRSGISLYAFPGHKGMLGPQGTGGLYIQPGLTLETLREGGTGSNSESLRQGDDRPERYESGTNNLHGIAGLLAGARYVTQNAAQIQSRERERTAQLLEGLRRLREVTLYDYPSSPRVGVVSFNVSDYTSGTVADALDRAGFMVRGGLHCAPGVHRLLGTLSRGAVRVSVGHETTSQEIDGFLSAVYAIIQKGI